MVIRQVLFFDAEEVIINERKFTFLKIIIQVHVVPASIR